MFYTIDSANNWFIFELKFLFKYLFVLLLF